MMGEQEEEKKAELGLVCKIKRKFLNEKKEETWSLGMVAHAFDSSTWGKKQADLYEFKVSLTRIVSSRAAIITQWDNFKQLNNMFLKRCTKNSTKKKKTLRDDKHFQKMSGYEINRYNSSFLV